MSVRHYPFCAFFTRERITAFLMRGEIVTAVSRTGLMCVQITVQCALIHPHLSFFTPPWLPLVSLNLGSASFVNSQHMMSCFY